MKGKEEDLNGVPTAGAYISAGDCLWAEHNNPNSPYGVLINKYIENGEIVPKELKGIIK